MIEGLFIVVEGVDGAGTTTHAKLLKEAFEGRGLPVLATHEPSGGPVGVLLRQVLRGRVVVPGRQGPHAPGAETMALLFAADRLDHLEAEVLPNLQDGVTVVCDRYDHSSIAYQGLPGGDAETSQWVRALNSRARRPDLTIVLDVPPEVSAERRRKRGGVGQELYDDPEFQEKLPVYYRDIEQYFPNDRVVHVDADRPTEEVAADVQRHVWRLRGEQE